MGVALRSGWKEAAGTAQAEALRQTCEGECQAGLGETLLEERVYRALTQRWVRIPDEAVQLQAGGATRQSRGLAKVQAQGLLGLQATDQSVTHRQPVKAGDE